MRSATRIVLALAAAAAFPGLSSCGGKSPPAVAPGGGETGGGETGGGETGGGETGGGETGGGTGGETPKAVLPTVEKTLAEVGLDGTAIDKKINPCDDFFQYACGGWLERTPIPADKARWSRGFDEITERNLATLREMLEQAQKNADDPVAKKLGAYYGACMDEKAVEKAGTKSIDSLLKTARGVKDGKGLAKAIAELHKRRIFPLFDLGPQQDARDATLMIGVIDQNGLGLPDRDYYLKDDEKMKGIRAAYATFVERIFELGGVKGKKGKEAAADVLVIENQIAQMSKSRVERRNPEGMYNRIERKGLVEKAPDFAWDVYLETLGHGDIQTINVTSVPFVEGLNQLVKTVKPAQWQNYLVYTVLRSSTAFLPKAFVDEAFALRKTITGAQQIEDRWKRCVNATNFALGELLGQYFVKVKFGPASKEATESMVAGIRQAFGETVRGLDWMDAATKDRALKKLQQMVFQIGYPNKWREYTFKVDAKSYGANSLAAAEFEHQRQLNKIGKPVDRDEWFMSPPTVNAYYEPALNTMVFPAGILQPPFFNADAPVHVNLGSMGMVVGHELTHGFDDEGSQYDGDGNLKSWWEPAVRKKFEEKTACVVNQYEAYEVLPGVHLNGKLTLGENIADIAGMKLAYQAAQAFHQGAKESIVAEGFDEDQQFFLSSAQMWCANARDEALRDRVVWDPHSWARYRVNGPMSNLPEFAKAFSCPAGSKMAPKKPCTVW
jgi:putative endopeptidase